MCLLSGLYNYIMLNFLAWENFESGKYTEALDCVNQIKMTPTAGVQFLLVKLFQANCHLYLVRKWCHGDTCFWGAWSAHYKWELFVR